MPFSYHQLCSTAAFALFSNYIAEFSYPACQPFCESQQDLSIISFSDVTFIAGLLHWIALHCTGVQQ